MLHFTLCANSVKYLTFPPQPRDLITWLWLLLYKQFLTGNGCLSLTYLPVPCEGAGSCKPGSSFIICWSQQVDLRHTQSSITPNKRTQLLSVGFFHSPKRLSESFYLCITHQNNCGRLYYFASITVNCYSHYACL